ncbi:MAG: transrane transport protein [Chloroflexi bacterium]|jgi:BASS family bile acid:Na+ symporter|nr:transrane transport protein [Chloroflexota bacterium]
MTLNDFISAIAGISGLLFVVTSMLAMSLKLSLQQMTQPLKNARLVILALLANFVLVPLLAYTITKVIPLEQSLQIGIILLGTAAGAPFIPKLVQGAKGNVAYAVGLMFLIMVVTIFYLPFILPLLLPGVEVNPWDIAKSLIVTMLIPLLIGMLIKSHSPDVADHWAPVMNKISSLSVLILLVVGLGLNISNILSFIGTLGIGAMVLLILGALVIGMLFGGRDPGVRSAMALSTANRNGAAALLVATQNFSGTDTLPFVLVGVVLVLLILLPIAKRMGARSQAAAAPVKQTE